MRGGAHSQQRRHYSTSPSEVVMLEKLEGRFPELGPFKFLVSWMTITGAVLGVSEVLSRECG